MTFNKAQKQIADWVQEAFDYGEPEYTFKIFQISAIQELITEQQARIEELEAKQKFFDVLERIAVALEKVAETPPEESDDEYIHPSMRGL